jgi:hypothetical protein
MRSEVSGVRATVARMALSITALSGCYSGLRADAGGESLGDTSNAGESGEAGDESGTGEPSDELSCDDIGTQPLRRVSSSQYEQLLRDLLPPAFAEQALAVSVFPRTAIDGGFSTYAAANTVSSTESIQIEDTAERIAQVFYDNRVELAPALMPCLPAGWDPSAIDDCIDGFVADFGARAFRRELTERETEIVLGLYASISTSDGPEVGLTAVLQYFLQAPALLYLTEQTGDGESVVPLSPAELAARLAILFRESAPDDALRTAVAEGRLVTREDVEREARRLASDPAVARAFARFHHEWMRGFELEESEREHPLWNDASAAALREELGAFATWFLQETDGTFATLMTTQSFTPDARLDDLHAGGEARPGLLTTAAAMAAQAHPESTSLVTRGAFVRNHVLCIPTPPFPGNIDTESALEGYGDLPTGRERLEPLMHEPACAACHVGINPLGFPLEVYDWAGAYRAEENGTRIDTSVHIDLGVFEGDFANASELLEAIGGSDVARECYATHWFRYAVGRPETPEDTCSIEAVNEAFAASGGDVRELLVAIAVSDAFRFRKVVGGGD